MKLIVELVVWCGVVDNMWLINIVAIHQAWVLV